MILVLICISIGIFLRRTGKLTSAAAPIFNSFVIWISLPALVIEKIHALSESQLYSKAMVLPISMPWLQVAFAATFYWAAKRWTRQSKAVLGTLLLTLGFGNTSFVGFPLLRALIGTQAIPPAVLLDQLGSFLALSTVGVIFATGGSHGFLGTVKRVITFPAFVALVFAVLTRRFEFPISFNEAVMALNATLVPLALVSVGVQLNWNREAIFPRLKMLTLGLGIKLVVFPLLVAGLYRLWLSPGSLEYSVIVLESGMAPMITAGILASESGFDPELASLMVGVGIPLSLVTVSVWATLLRVIAP